MTTVQFTALLPLLGIAGTSMILMAAVAVRRDRRWSVAITVIGLAVSLGFVFVARSAAPCEVSPLLLIDGFALFFFALLITATAVVVLLASNYFARRDCDPEELFLLLLFATLGGCVLAASTHFASLFLGLEILSVSLYSMVAYLRRSERGIEAGVKYLILAAVSSAFMLFGMALVYADTGSLAITLPPAMTLMTLAGVALMMVGVGFKLALAPFHMWTADVYEGAPAPVTAYVATVSKAAMVAFLLRLLAAAGEPTPQLVWFMALLAGASILIGNLLALRQENIKRLLAYSSIAHLGYLMIAVIAGGADGGEAAAFYLAAYIPTTLIAFGVITVLSPADRDSDLMEDYQGLGARRPVVAGLLTAALLSLAGIPLTAGFVGKFLVLGTGVETGQWTLALVLVLGSVISIFYYLRVIVAMYMSEPVGEAPPPNTPRVPLAIAATLAVLLAIVLWLGVWPAPLLRVIHATVGAL